MLPGPAVGPALPVLFWLRDALRRALSNLPCLTSVGFPFWIPWRQHPARFGSTEGIGKSVVPSDSENRLDPIPSASPTRESGEERRYGKTDFGADCGPWWLRLPYRVASPALRLATSYPERHAARGGSAPLRTSPDYRLAVRVRGGYPLRLPDNRLGPGAVIFQPSQETLRNNIPAWSSGNSASARIVPASGPSGPHG